MAAIDNYAIDIVVRIGHYNDSINTNQASNLACSCNISSAVTVANIASVTIANQAANIIGSSDCTRTVNVVDYAPKIPTNYSAYSTTTIHCTWIVAIADCTRVNLTD